jgi:DNA-binding response OmpR family regulator
VSIIVIDDEKGILRTFSKILRTKNYNVDTAETARKGKEMIEKGHYDAAIIDVKLPDMEGPDLLANLKDYPNMIKIMITGSPTVENNKKALDNGADEYLIKPIKPEELLEIIQEKIGN